MSQLLTVQYFLFIHFVKSNNVPLIWKLTDSNKNCLRQFIQKYTSFLYCELKSKTKFIKFLEIFNKIRVCEPEHFTLLNFKYIFLIFQPSIELSEVEVTWIDFKVFCNRARRNPINLCYIFWSRVEVMADKTVVFCLFVWFLKWV